VTLRSRVFLALALLVVTVGCTPTHTPSAPASAASPATPAAGGQPERMPIEYQLAVVDSQQLIDRNDPRIAHYATNLDRLEAHCTENRVQLADLAVRTSQVLHERQHPNSALEVLDAANLAIPDEAPEISCIDIFSGLVVLTTNT